MAALNANLGRAAAAWGKTRLKPGSAGTPDWIAVLAGECDRLTQGKVAEQLGISAAVVNQVLGNAYKGRLDGVEARVRGEYMKAVVECPVLGEISTRDCIGHQRRKFMPTNPLRVQLRKACPVCVNREKAKCSSK